MSVRPVSSGGGGYSFQPNSIITFVAEGESFQIESRFLLVCDYFNTMFGNGMQESQKRQFEVEGTCKEAVQAFLTFLKTHKLPQLEIGQLIDLYMLVHEYQYDVLLSQVRQLLEQQCSSHLKSILSIACLYNDTALKQECKNQLERIWEIQGLVSELIDDKSYSVVQEILTWGKSIKTLLIYKDEMKQSPLSKLLDQRQYKLASEGSVTLGL